MTDDELFRKRVLEFLETEPCPHCGDSIGFVSNSIGYCQWCLQDLPNIMEELK